MRAASAEFSTQAIAGTINIVLKTKVVAAQRELKITSEGSNAFKASALDLQVSDKLKQLSYTLGVNLRMGSFNQDSSQRDDGTDALGQPSLLRQDSSHEDGKFASASLSPRLIWNLSDGATLTSQTLLNLNHSHRQGTNHWAAQIGPLPPYPIDLTQYRSGFDLLRTDLNWVRKLADSGKFDVKLGLNASRRDSNFDEQGFDASRLQTLDSNTLATAHDRGATLVGKYSTPFADEHTLTGGWDGASTRRSEQRVESDRPIPGYAPNDSAESYSAVLNRLALFTQDEWSITPKWSLYLGLRWETLDTRSQGNTFDAVRNRSSVWSPLFQTLWKFPGSQNDQIRFALTRSYKAPGINRLIPRRYTNANNSSVTPDFQGNPALKPELATGVDLAYEHFFAEGALLSASVYRRQIDDFTHNNVSLLGGRWVSMPINDGRAQTHGLELEAKFPLQLFYRQAPALELRVNLARNGSAVDGVPGPNNRIADQTPLSGNVGLDYKVTAAFNFGGNFTYKSGGPIRISDSSSSYSSIKREMDVYGLWKFDAKHQLRLSAANLLAQPYTSVAQYADGSGSLRSTSIYPYSATLRATLELKL